MDTQEHIPSSTIPPVVSERPWIKGVPEENLEDFFQKINRRKAKRAATMQHSLHLRPHQITWYKFSVEDIEQGTMEMGVTETGVKVEIGGGTGRNSWEGQGMGKWVFTTKKDSEDDNKFPQVIRTMGFGTITRCVSMVELNSDVPCWGSELHKAQILFNSEENAAQVETKLNNIKSNLLRYLNPSQPTPSPMSISVEISSHSGGVSDEEGVQDIDLEEEGARDNN